MHVSVLNDGHSDMTFQSWPPSADHLVAFNDKTPVQLDVSFISPAVRDNAGVVLPIGHAIDAHIDLPDPLERKAQITHWCYIDMPTFVGGGILVQLCYPVF